MFIPKMTKGFTLVFVDVVATVKNIQVNPLDFYQNSISGM